MATIDATGSRLQREPAKPKRPSAQMVGGMASIIEGLCYAGLLVLFTVLMPAIGWQFVYWDDPSKAVAFVRSHEVFFGVSGLFFIVQALLVLPVVLAVHDRLRSHSASLTSTATVFGVVGMAMLLINALVEHAEFHAFSSLPIAVAEQAEPYGNVAYQATIAGAGICLGLWMLLVGWATVRRGAMPRWIGYLGLLTGIANLAVVVFSPDPGRLLSVAWFIAIGVVLVRGGSHADA